MLAASVTPCFGMCGSRQGGSASWDPLAHGCSGPRGADAHCAWFIGVMLVAFSATDVATIVESLMPTLRFGEARARDAHDEGKVRFARSCATLGPRSKINGNGGAQQHRGKNKAHHMPVLQ